MIDITVVDCSLDQLNDVQKRLPHSLLDDIVVPFEIEVPFTIKPHAFLEYAQFELECIDERNLINCLSNCKRAIECQVDSLLFSLGIYNKVKKKGWNFHKKLETLNQFGIITPIILKKITKHRNLLEHDYLKPDPEKVADAVDIAVLFLNYTDKYLKSAIDSFVIFIDDNDPTQVEYDYHHGKIVFSTLIGDDDGAIIDATIIKEISADSNEYYDYLIWYFSIVKYINRW